MDEPKRPNVLARLFKRLSKHRMATLIVLSVVVVCTGNLIAYLITSPKPTAKTKTSISKIVKKTEPTIILVKYYSPLTGALVADDTTTKQTVTGIMIENSPESRPQSGLKNSGVVFEAIAEGGITRFLVLYQQEKPQLIGPVRSVRIYYVDWLAAFNASIVHVGGSAAALAEVSNGNYRNLDQFYNGNYFWRSTDRYAPHNVYTSFEKLDALNTSKRYTSSTFTGFTRIDGKASDTPNAININVTISSSLFNSSYIYNKTTNTYDRSQAGAPHLDRESGQISPSVVVAMRVDEVTMSDGHESITTIGSGNATIFQNGVAVNAIWHKTDKTSQITFTDSAGTDIPLVRGQTWLVAVPNDDGDVSWN